MRVLHVARRYAPLLGGTERYIEDLAHAQAARGHRVFVVTLDRDVTGMDPTPLAARDTIDGIPVLRLPGSGNRRVAVTWRPDRLLRAMRSADIVHLHDLRFGFLLAVAGSMVDRRPLILHTHGLIFHTPWAQRLKVLAMRTFFGPLLRLGRVWVVASSAPDRSALLQHAPYLADRTVVLENAIRLGDLLRLERDPVAGALLVQGRISVSKGIDDLLRALALVSTPWRLELVGPAEAAERRRLEEIVRELGLLERVTFHGPYPRHGLGDHLGRAWAAVFPSRGEGFGLALLEAMAAGVPVLASNIPAHRALLGDELADRAVDFTAPPVAAAALRRLLSLPADEARRLGEFERGRALGFDIQRLADQIDDLYRVIGVS